MFPHCSPFQPLCTTHQPSNYPATIQPGLLEARRGFPTSLPKGNAAQLGEAGREAAREPASLPKGASLQGSPRPARGVEVSSVSHSNASSPGGRHEASCRAWGWSRGPCSQPSPEGPPACPGAEGRQARARPPRPHLPTVWLASCFMRLNCFFMVAVPSLPRSYRAARARLPARLASAARSGRPGFHLTAPPEDAATSGCRRVTARPVCLPAPEHRAAPGNAVRIIESERAEGSRPVLLESRARKGKSVAGGTFLPRPGSAFSRWRGSCAAVPGDGEPVCLSDRGGGTGLGCPSGTCSSDRF